MRRMTDPWASNEDDKDDQDDQDELEDTQELGEQQQVSSTFPSARSPSSFQSKNTSSNHYIAHVNGSKRWG